MSDSINIFEEGGFEKNQNQEFDSTRPQAAGGDFGCDTVSPQDSFNAQSLQIEVAESIRKQVIEYEKKKAERGTPPYVTYEDDELIYLPTIIWVSDKPGDKDWTDADWFQMIEWINEMLAGTYSYTPTATDTQNATNGIHTPGTYGPTAQNDPQHGIDSGIRLRLCPQLPKEYFNPMFQPYKGIQLEGNTGGASSLLFGTIYNKSQNFVNLRNGQTLSNIEEHACDNLTHYGAFENKQFIPTLYTSIANLTEDRVGCFTCGQYGSVIRFPYDEFKSPFNQANNLGNIAKFLNEIDVNYLFSDETPYDVWDVVDDSGNSAAYGPTRFPWVHPFLNSRADSSYSNQNTCYTYISYWK